MRLFRWTFPWPWAIAVFPNDNVALGVPRQRHSTRECMFKAMPCRSHVHVQDRSPVPPHKVQSTDRLHAAPCGPGLGGHELRALSIQHGVRNNAVNFIHSARAILLSHDTDGKSPRDRRRFMQGVPVGRAKGTRRQILAGGSNPSYPTHVSRWSVRVLPPSRHQLVVAYHISAAPREAGASRERPYKPGAVHSSTRLLYLGLPNLSNFRVEPAQQQDCPSQTVFKNAASSLIQTPKNPQMLMMTAPPDRPSASDPELAVRGLI